MRDIAESDWKLFRTVREAALDRYCARVLKESAAILAEERETNHERYIRLFRLLAKRDRTIADTFNDPRRSVARLQLAQMVRPRPRHRHRARTLLRGHARCGEADPQTRVAGARRITGTQRDARS